MSRRSIPRSTPLSQFKLSVETDAEFAHALAAISGKAGAVAGSQFPLSAAIDLSSRKDHRSRQQTLSRLKHYRTVFRATPALRANAIKAGLPAAALGAIAADLGLSQKVIFDWTGIKEGAIRRKLTRQLPLNCAEGDAAIGLAKLVGQVVSIVSESGTFSEFGSSAWLGAWPTQPLPALEGTPPGELLDTAESRMLVSQVLSHAQTGTYL